MTTPRQHLGTFSDWVDAAAQQRVLRPVAAPGEATRDRAREVLGFTTGDESPREVRVERRWERDDVAGEQVSWSVGYGPRTSAWVLRPAGENGPLPGVVALHDHGGFKYFGKEKIAEGPEPTPGVLTRHFVRYYGGRAFANALAREGFVVLVPDTFLWGSRRFPLEAMPAKVRTWTAAGRQLWAPDDDDPLAEQVAHYNAAAGLHEDVVEKYANLLGTTLAGVVAYEDRVALGYLASRPDVARLGCLGLSGGGNRATLLTATDERLSATAVVGLMSTYEGLLDHNVASHTWMLYPHGWSRHGDWPDLAAAAAPRPLLVQYDLDDELFTQAGMRAADARIAEHYVAQGSPDAYTGQFYPGPHKFDLDMQAAAFAWLQDALSPA